MASPRAKHGADFDRALLQHEVAFHKSVIDAIQTTLLPAIQNQELKALVEKVVRAFQAHLLAAQRLERQLHEAGPTAAKQGASERHRCAALAAGPNEIVGSCRRRRPRRAPASFAKRHSPHELGLEELGRRTSGREARNLSCRCAAA